MYILFFHFLFRFLWKTKKKNEPPPFAPLFPPFWGGSSAASPLEIWDVMPPYLNTLFEQKTDQIKIKNHDFDFQNHDLIFKIKIMPISAYKGILCQIFVQIGQV